MSQNKRFQNLERRIKRLENAQGFVKIDSPLANAFPTISRSKITLQDIADLIYEKSKLLAIKETRVALGVGLKEAKDIVDVIASALKVPNQKL